MSDFTPYWEDKIWGRVLHVFASKHAAISYLNVEQDCWCSEHYHNQRANVFVCITATIEVIEWDGMDRVTYLLQPGESHTVPSKRTHQFRVIESGEVIEVYYPDVINGVVEISDIVRRTVGGRK